MVVTEQSGGTEASTLRQEHAAFQEQNRLLQAEVIALRQQAHYHRTQHQRAVQRAQELQVQVGVLKAKVAELQQRLFGRKSELAERPLWAQAGKAAAVLEPEVSNPAVPAMVVSSGRISRWWRLCWTSPNNKKRCPHCGLAWEGFRQPHISEQIEWEVRLFRRRTIRPKYRRPSGCHCQPQRPDIISAPFAPALIPKGILAPSFLSEVLVLKFLYHMPLERIRAMVRSAGLVKGCAEL